MRKPAAIALTLVVLATTACGSAGLTDEEEAYCQTLDAVELERVAEGIGIDLEPVFEEGQRIFDEAAEAGDPEAAFEQAIEYTLGDGRFIDTCKQAYADR